MCIYIYIYLYIYIYIYIYIYSLNAIEDGVLVVRRAVRPGRRAVRARWLLCMTILLYIIIIYNSI